MQDIAIVTGVLVIRPVGEVDEEEIADDAIINLRSPVTVDEGKIDGEAVFGSGESTVNNGDAE